MKISDFDQLKRVSKYGGVYVFMDVRDYPIYVGHAKKTTFGGRISNHYKYLQPRVHSISIYPTNEHRLLEYTLIQRLYPTYNRDRDWNQITRSQCGTIPYMLPEDSYWGHKFFKKGYLPFEINSPQDHLYLDCVDRLIKELKRLSELTAFTC